MTKKNLSNVLIEITLQVSIIIAFGYIIYEQMFSGTDDYFEKTIFSFFILVMVAGILANYSKGQWEDKLVTLFIILVIYIIYYISWWNFTNFFDFNIKNPLVIGYFIVLSFFSIIILVSRFTYLNIVKAAGWGIGLSVLGLFIFTFSIYETLSNCNTQTVGVEDPLYISLSIYFTWFIVICILFFSELHKWGQTKIILLGVSIMLIAILLNYTWNRCEPNDKQLDLKDQPTWIDNSSHLITIMAYLNIFIGHLTSSGILGFASYSILDQCVPENDPRRIAIGALLLILLPFLFFIKFATGSILNSK